jgi:hypothetical protein
VYPLLLIILLCVFAMSARDALRYPGVDLRCKVVGARLLLAHLNAYPDPARPEPNQFYRMFNNNTYSPALLLLYSPLCRLPYEPQRLLYFGFDWLCVGYIFLGSRGWFPAARRGLHAAFFVLFLITDFALRLHMERGQYYLLIAALTVAAISSWRKQNDSGGLDSGWLGALALGVLILIRPTFLIVIPMLWIYGLRWQVLRSFVVAATFGAVTLAAFGVQPWTDYLHTVSALQQRYISNIFMPVARPLPVIQYDSVEGENFTKELGSSYFVSRASVGFIAGHAALAVRFCKTPAVFTRENNGLLLLTALYCLVVACLLRNSSLDIKLGFGFLAPIMVESFGPQRLAYCDVTLAPILLIIVAIILDQESWQRYRIAIATVIAICVLSSIAPLVTNPVGKLITGLSLARWVVLLLCANAYLAIFARRDERAKKNGMLLVAS